MTMLGPIWLLLSLHGCVSHQSVKYGSTSPRPQMSSQSCNQIGKTTHKGLSEKQDTGDFYFILYAYLLPGGLPRLETPSSWQQSALTLPLAKKQKSQDTRRRRPASGVHPVASFSISDHVTSKLARLRQAFFHTTAPLSSEWTRGQVSQSFWFLAKKKMSGLVW